jgi:hypothetical protein
MYPAHSGLAWHWLLSGVPFDVSQGPPEAKASRLRQSLQFCVFTLGALLQ